MKRSQAGETSIGWMVVILLIAFMAVHAWDHHEARHNRIECAKFNADSHNLSYPERPPVTINLDACHPSAP